MTNTEFMYAVVAELWAGGEKSLDSNDPELHRSMRKAMETLGKQRLLENGVRLYFDPITETLGDLFHTASLLQSLKLAKRSNPSYSSEMSLQMDEGAHFSLLQHLKSKERKFVREFAAVVRQSLPAGNPA